MAGGKGIKNQNEILKLLEAVWEPNKGHQKGKDSVSEGNRHADAVARLAAKEQAAPSRIMLVPELPEPLKYTPQEEWAQREGGTAVHPHKPGDQVWVKAAHQLDNQHPEWKVTSDLNHPMRIIFKKMLILKKPQAMIDLLEMIFQAQKPTWVDCKQLLFRFFNTEECMRIVTEARKWLQTQAPAGILDTDRWVREAFPDEKPDWTLNSEDGRARLERYWLAFLQGCYQQEPPEADLIGLAMADSD
ncbi:hypothetical protein QTO34_014767 [Cnephaeus nilssonii]|uniref:Core shell protein Gag P30 domain-containing protein n=1 Tax=Cnephaeus nilssonii TaxID=3371016 RepID=A0AA40I867_CNENI|nr:hypothetical protein QTO34_014767 [Eptesicus nilssonii]